MDRRHTINKKTTFTDIREILDFAEREYGEKIAFSYRENPHDQEIKAINYIAFHQDVKALGTKLILMGAKGKKIGLVGKLSYQWIVTYYATLSIGSVLVPLDSDWSAEDLTDALEKAEAEFLFGDNAVAEKLEYARLKLNLLSSPVYLGAERDENSFFQLIEDGRREFLSDPDVYESLSVNPMKMSLLVFTSGTTGKGKGVMLSQNAIISDMYNAVHYLDYGKKTIAVLPPHHTYGSTIMFIGHVMIGCEVYISSGLRYITKELAEQKPEHLVLVPLYLETFYRRILATLKEKGKYDMVLNMIKVNRGLKFVGFDRSRKIFSAIHAVFGGNVKMIVSGGAPISREIMEFYEGIGISVLNGYGITECAPLISVNRSKNNVVGSVGNPSDEVEVIIDEPNLDGEGEILVKGPNVMLGYYKDDEATAQAFKKGYFRTGDYGKFDKNGILYITGRKKNLIILSNGKNVYPEEIENELSAIPGILDVVVFEGQSKRGISYNAIVAEVYPDLQYFKDNNIDDAKVYFKPYIDQYNKKALPYKKVSILKVRNEDFPKNTLRKIQRFKLNTTID